MGKYRGFRWLGSLQVNSYIPQHLFIYLFYHLYYQITDSCYYLMAISIGY